MNAGNAKPQAGGGASGEGTRAPGGSVRAELPLVLFSKHFATLAIEELIECAQRWGIEGYDLACRRGQTINPGNVATLPEAVAKMRRAGLTVAMITGEGRLLDPADPTAEPTLGAMNDADVRYLKLGYWAIDNQKEDYWERVDAIRKLLEGWEKLGRKHGVRVCYHTHSDPQFMGLNAAAVMHLVRGFDPRWIGVYLDPGHLILDGEHPDIAFNMVRHHLAIVALKDAMKLHSPVARGYDYVFSRAGYGHVDWACVFTNLRRLNFRGPLSIHAEFDRYLPTDAQGKRVGYEPALIEEVAFFKRRRDSMAEE